MQGADAAEDARKATMGWGASIKGEITDSAWAVFSSLLLTEAGGGRSFEFLTGVRNETDASAACELCVLAEGLGGALQVRGLWARGGEEWRRLFLCRPRDDLYFRFGEA